MKATTLHELFVDELKGALDVERQLAEALPDIAKHAQDADLKKTLTEHLKETKEQAKRLEKILKGLKQEVEPRACTAMQAIIKEGGKMIAAADEAVRDVVITASGGKIEQYEGAMYTALHGLASQLGHKDAADALKESLGEELETGKAGVAAMKRVAKTAPTGL